mmetsp:Transcript_18154/g.25116  ORF Transcript_18154/g.25116 Transcript_18154/m.25116 type:complete len:179 (-) Transcript_18154:296-832(-)
MELSSRFISQICCTEFLGWSQISSRLASVSCQQLKLSNFEESPNLNQFLSVSVVRNRSSETRSVPLEKTFPRILEIFPTMVRALLAFGPRALLPNGISSPHNTILDESLGTPTAAPASDQTPPFGDLEDCMLMATKRTYQPNVLHRKRQHGFLKRLATPGGRRVLNRKRQKKRSRLSA